MSSGCAARLLRAILMVAVSGLGIATTVAPAGATAEYTYKRGEYVQVTQGLSPNRHFSISTHGDGEGGYDNFHAYLMVEPGHRKIGPLEEIGDNILDTEARAYTAVWSPDSQHVAIFYRSDRHILAIQMYRIQNRRAYPVAAPSLLLSVDPHSTQKLADSSLRYQGGSTVRWLSSTRFIFTEKDDFHLADEAYMRTLGKFSKSEKLDPQSSDDSVSYFIHFSAEAVCEVTSKDACRIIRIKPGKFDE